MRKNTPVRTVNFASGAAATDAISAGPHPAKNVRKKRKRGISPFSGHIDLFVSDMKMNPELSHSF